MFCFNYNLLVLVFEGKLCYENTTKMLLIVVCDPILSHRKQVLPFQVALKFKKKCFAV